MWVKLEADGDKLLKVTWGNQDGFFEDTYSIGVATLNECAEAVRGELAKLSEWAVGRSPDSRWERLTALAKAGKALHSALMIDVAMKANIKAIRQLIEMDFDSGQRVLKIYVDSSLHLPWGLVFDGKVPATPGDLPADSPEKAEMALFSNFWALKYDLSVGSMLKVPGSLDSQRERFGLLSLVNDQVYQCIDQQADDSCLRELCELMRARVGTAKSLEECQDLIEDTDASDILFHFFGHQHDQTLDLGSGGTVSLVEFCELMGTLVDRGRDHNASPYGLMFLNGCESALGKDDYSFRSRALSAGVFGVIATESIVRMPFAARFGHRFLKSMVQDGRTVSATMHDLWHAEDLWPESLLYGCYANPLYCIKKGSGTSAGAR